MKRLLLTLIVPLTLIGFCTADVEKIDTVELWTKNCKKCHGDDGVPTKIGTKFGARDYTDAAVQASFTDEEAVKITKEGIVEDGKKIMPPYADKLSDEEIADLVKLIRSFAK